MQTPLRSLRPVYQTICYFDIFKYPLKEEEVYKFCSEKFNQKELKAALAELISLKKINCSGEFYYLSGSDENNISLRKANEEYLAEKLQIIKRFSKLISRFPFVEAVFISGSASKGVLEKGDDVDYFIIAKPRRVWVCRSLLITFKKIALLNSKKYFCVNYFIDSDYLNIPDKNIFTATEIRTLKPVYQNKFTQRFEKLNEWAYEYFPNYSGKNEQLLKEIFKKPLFSKMIESMMSSSLGERADNYFFKKTLQRWQKKFPHFSKEIFDLNMRSKKNVSKHHPQGNQIKVLNVLDERMKNF